MDLSRDGVTLTMSAGSTRFRRVWFALNPFAMESWRLWVLCKATANRPLVIQRNEAEICWEMWQSSSSSLTDREKFLCHNFFPSPFRFLLPLRPALGCLESRFFIDDISCHRWEEKEKHNEREKDEESKKIIFLCWVHAIETEVFRIQFRFRSMNGSAMKRNVKN